MRKLVTIRKVSDIKPIKDADLICAYKIDGWWVVDKKDAHQIGDKVIYFEIDSFLPIKPEFEFLRKSSYKKLVDGTEGFRLKTIKLKGQISQGLIIKCDIEGDVGDDVTDNFGVIKYEPPIPAELRGQVEGLFPSFIVKTDEERIQNLNDDLSNKEVYVTEKLEGTSFTVYVNNGKIGVCSRNLEFKRDPNNSFWKFVINNDLENNLLQLNRNIALQGEFIGYGVQGNIYKLNEQTIRFFNVFDIDAYKRFNFTDFLNIIKELNLQTVPIIDSCLRLPNDNVIDFLLNYSEGKSQINSNTEREGIVIRCLDNSNISYKAISNKYLLKEK